MIVTNQRYANSEPITCILAVDITYTEIRWVKYSLHWI